VSDARKLEVLLIPALRARMGDWIYYVAAMKMIDIAERVSVVPDIHRAASLNELLQRVVDESGQARKIATYLLTQEQRFFDSLVLGVYGGDPEWYQIDLQKNDLFDPGVLSVTDQSVLGFLRLDGGEKIFAIDGQHRVVGIKQAMGQDPDLLASQEVTTIFLAHDNSAEGMERTRRLFSTLNRYARPVTKGEIIALDEDDVVAIVTRRLVDIHPLFGNRVSTIRSKNIPPSDKSSFTSIAAIYDALDFYLRTLPRGWGTFKRSRPPDEEIDGFSFRAMQLVEGMIDAFHPLQEVVASEPKTPITDRYRSEARGGHLLFRPIGFQMVVRVIRRLMDEGLELGSALGRVASVPMMLDDWPWSKLLWNPANRQMITTAGAQRVAELFLLYLCGGDLTRARTDESKLRQDLAAATGVDVVEVRMA
jgi:DNA sulfur modification protein DndB